MRKLIPLLFLVPPLMLTVPSFTQAAEESSNTDARPSEIQVTGFRNRFQLEKQTFEAERKVYDLFNTLNTENKYDIECHNEYQTGTRIRSVNCRPNFVDKLLMLESDVSVNVDGEVSGSDSFSYGYEELSPWLKERHLQRLQEIMKELVVENPELARAVLDHAKLAEQLNKTED